MTRYLTDINRALVPTVVEETQRGERGWDLFSRLLKDRIVLLGSAIDDAWPTQKVATGQRRQVIVS